MEWHKIRIPIMDIRGRETRTKCAHRGVMHTAKFLKFEFLFEKKNMRVNNLVTHFLYVDEGFFYSSNTKIKEKKCA